MFNHLGVPALPAGDVFRFPRHACAIFRLALGLLIFSAGTILPATGTVNSVSVQSPTLSANTVNNVTSPIHVQATAKGSLSITGFIVYIDGNVAYRNMLSTAETWVPLAPGSTHSIYVKAWDSSGASLATNTYTIKVGSMAPPVAPNYATHVTEIDQNTSQWVAANTAGVGGQCNTGKLLSYPSDYDPNTAIAPGGFDYGQHFMVASKCTYDDGLFYWKNAASVAPSKTNFLWDFWFFIPTTTLSNHVQALEFDLFQAVKMSNGVHEFMFGSQCNYATNQLQLWLPENGSLHWTNAGVSPCTFAAGTWHHATYFLQRVTKDNYQMITPTLSPSTDTNSGLRFATLTLDGNTFYLGKTSSSTLSKWAQTFGVQHQLDTSSSGIIIEEYVTAESVYAW